MSDTHNYYTCVAAGKNLQMSVCTSTVLTDFAVFVCGPRGAPLADRGGVVEVRVSGGRRLADEARPLLVVAPLPHAQLVPRPVDRLVVAVSLAVPRPDGRERTIASKDSISDLRGRNPI